MSKTFAISDLEGFYPDQVLPMYNSIKYDKLNEIIVCGDIIDSTIKSTPTPSILELKSNNLKTIYDIVVNSNICLTFGNRDLNKIKVGPLTELCYYGQDENSRKLINSFNSGDLENLNITTFYNIFNIKEKRWCQNMSNWYPFWGEKIIDNIDYWKNNNEPIKIVKEGKPEPYLFFEKRFHKIFGTDTTVGTMNANNLLKTIPIELGLYAESFPEYNAFIVLAVFKSMLQKVKFNDDGKLYEILYNPISYPNINQSIFKGLLYSLFTDDKNKMIIKRTDYANTYLFSHGGVSSDIIERNTLQELDDILNDINTFELRDKITDVNKLRGGYYKNTTIDIDQQIEKFNTRMKEIIMKIFDEDYKILNKPTSNMLLLLIAITPFDCKTFYSKTLSKPDVILKCKNLGILNTNSSLISTMAGIKELRSQNKIFYYGNRLFNIFGHSPNGFGPTVDLFENDIHKTYLVNLDTSNTFLSTSSNQSLYDQSLKTSSYILIENNKIRLLTEVYIKSSKNERIKIENNEDLLFSNIEFNQSDSTEINNLKNNIVLAYSGEDLSDVIRIKIDNYIDQEMDQKLRLFKDNKNIFYHGNIDNYLVFNYRRTLEPPFPRCFYIIDEKIFSKRYKYKKEDTVRYKYLKYKNKYINLKNNQTI